MMKWLSTLTCHNYDITPPNTECELISPFLVAQRLLESKSSDFMTLPGMPEQTDKDSVVEDVS